MADALSESGNVVQIVESTLVSRVE